MIKIITGIKGCGKSYLLDPLFKNHLLESGVREDHIIKLELDREENEKYLNAHELYQFIKSQIKDKDTYYILLDEIQMVDKFETVLNSFLYERNLDVYVTGNNSKFLSSDIITEFRGRGDEIRENNQRKQLEVDFVCNQGNRRYYVQSALNLDTREKTIQEERPLMNIDDNFKKIIVVKDNIKLWFTEEGILVMGIQEFLLDKNSLDL